MGKEVVFFVAEWPGFEPRTSSIRRGRSIHSTTPHLASCYKKGTLKILMTLYLKGNNSSEMLIEIHNYIFDISARKT